MSHERHYTDINIDPNYKTDKNVSARWLMYGLFDIETERVIADIVSRHLINLGRLHPRIVDIGASNGSFLQLLGSELQQLEPELVAIEPNMGQHNPKADKKLDDLIEQEIGSYVGLSIPFKKPTVPMRWMPERAEVALPRLEDGSVDIASCLFMLYHVPEKGRKSVYDSLKTKVTDDGLIVVTTSGDENKSGTRRVEEKVAEILGVQAPPHMNAGFTSEKADEELAIHFPETEGYEIQRIRQRSQLKAVDDPLLTHFTRLSVLSLADQFNTSQVENYNAFSHVVEEAMAKVIGSNPEYLETVDRSIFVVQLR